MGDDETDEVPPTPTPTITIIRPSPTPVAEPTAEPVEESVYTVQAGDTLSTIADKFPGVTWLEIAAANDLEDPYPLSIGQRLIIPPPPSQVPTPTPAGTHGGENASAGELTTVRELIVIVRAREREANPRATV